MRSIIMGFAALALMPVTAGPARAQSGDQVEIAQQGRLEGKRDGAVTAFLGIPFAAPPVGPLRWKPPQAPARWDGIRKATEFGSSCFQATSPLGFLAWTHEFVPTNQVSEDCLTLNVWTPAIRPKKPMAVLFWIYGGGFSQGSSQVAIYNGANLANSGIVVVSINYRVGPLGFMAHPALTAESPEHASGNYGLLDAVAALQWVSKNIGRFGGDPARVTIAGQSAGAALVHDLIASPLSKGLFRGAIAQSGSGLNIPSPTLAEAEAIGSGVMRASGATSLAALRALPPEDIERAAAATAPASRRLRFVPIVDGYALPLSPDEAMAQKRFNDTPVLTGLTANERSFSPNFGTLTESAFRAQAQEQFKDLSTPLLATYGDRPTGEVQKLLARDQGVAATLMWSRERVRVSRKPVFVYLFSHPLPGPESSRYEAFHSGELPYVFNTLDTAPERKFTQIDRDLAATVGRYWVNFAKTGDPNGPDLPLWQAFSADRRLILDIAPGITSGEALSGEQLDLFDRYIRAGGQLGIL